MLKFVICVLIVVGCGYVGFVISLYYKKRERFFSDLVDFLQHAKTEIVFFQNRLTHIFLSFECGSELGKILKNRAGQIDGKETCVKKPVFLSDNEWQWIWGFLENIGRCDAQTEAEGIEQMIEKVVQTKTHSQVETKTKGTMAAKLGVVIGLAIAIIVI